MTITFPHDHCYPNNCIFIVAKASDYFQTEEKYFETEILLNI